MGGLLIGIGVQAAVEVATAVVFSAGVVLLLTLVCPSGTCGAAGTLTTTTTTLTVGAGTVATGGLVAAGMAGLLIWYDSASGQATVIYPNPQVHGQNSVPCSVSALGSHGHTGVHNTPRCRQVRNDCQNECDEILPTHDDGFAYDRCVNQCVYDNNCGGINYR